MFQIENSIQFCDVYDRTSVHPSSTRMERMMPEYYPILIIHNNRLLLFEYCLMRKLNEDCYDQSEKSFGRSPFYFIQSIVKRLHSMCLISCHE